MRQPEFNSLQNALNLGRIASFAVLQTLPQASARNPESSFFFVFSMTIYE